MGFFNPIAYFIRQFFRFLRSITGKLFIIFVLLFAVLILYMCIDKGVFALTSYTLTEDFFTDSDLNTARSMIGESIWNNPDYDIFLTNKVNWGGSPDTGMKAYFYINAKNIKNVYNNDVCYAFNGDYSNNINGYLQHGNGELRKLSDATRIDQSMNNLNYKQQSLYIPSYQDNFNNFVNFGTSSSPSSPTVLLLKPIRCSFPIYSSLTTFDSSTKVYPIYQNPFIETDSSIINNWSFDYLKINSGSVGYVYYDPLLDRTTYSDLYLKYVYDGITYSMPINSGFLSEWSSDNFIVEIPRTSLLTSVNIQNGKSVDFYLEVKQENVGDNIYFLGNYTFSLTTAEQEQIQQDSDKAVQGEILQSQQETNNKLDNLENSINNDNVDDMSSDFTNLGNGLTAEDNTGIDTIFQKLYDAFCNNEIQPVSLTIPFVNKSFTIDSNSVSSNFPSAVKSIVAVFVWGVIGLWVLKDIRTIIDKISEGSPEDVGSDVKKEVL